MAYLEPTDHLARLRANQLDDAVPYCLQQSMTDRVPELSIEEDNILVLRSK